MKKGKVFRIETYTRDFVRANPQMEGMIFLTVCRTNGKAYVGKTVRLDLLLSGRYIGSGGRRYQRAKAKYGREAFCVAVLERVVGTRDDINEAERRWIAFYRDRLGKRLYNETEGGDGLTSAGMLLRLSDPEYVRRLGEGNRRAWIDRQKRRDEMAARTAARNTRMYRVRAPSGEVFCFKNLKAFCLEHGLNYFSMRFVCQGRIFRKRGPYVGWVSLDHHPETEGLAA